MALDEKINKSIQEEQYALDRRSGIPFPPDVAGKEISIIATISKADEDLQGIIVSHGGKQNGYSLYIQNNTVHWLVKQNGKAYKTSSRGNLPAQQFVVQASLAEDGEMALMINDNKVGETKAEGLFHAAISPDRVRVGNDNMGEEQVGDYPDSFYFSGRMNTRASNLSLKIPSTGTPEEGETEASPAGSSSSAGAVTIKMGVIQHEMKFDKSTFTVKAGQQVTIDFENQDFMQHNMVIGEIGSLETIGKAADELARDPDGANMNYVPRIPEVIAYTPLVDPETSETLVFTAPDTPGEYIYICTVPGHWRIMNGIMVVE